MPPPQAIVCDLCGGKFFKNSFPIHRKKCQEKYILSHVECESCGLQISNDEWSEHITVCREHQRYLAEERKRQEQITALVRRRAQHRDEKEEEEEVDLSVAEQIATPDEDGRIPCQICQRKFTSDRIVKHQTVCITNHTKKRKIRVKTGENLRLKGTEFEQYKEYRSQTPPKETRWRDESLQLRNIVSEGRLVVKFQQAGIPLSALPPPRSIDEEPRTEEEMDIIVANALGIEENAVVQLQDGRQGVVRFLGAVNELPNQGIWTGIELYQAEGKHDGKLEHRYFTCRPEHGAFVRPEKLVVIERRTRAKQNQRSVLSTNSKAQNQKLEKTSRAASPATNNSSHDNAPIQMQSSVDTRAERKNDQNWTVSLDSSPSFHDFSLGERVKLKDGREGRIAFVGPVSELPGSGEWLGIQFDNAVGKSNGSVKGQRYFECQELHGSFVRPAHILETLVDDNLEETKENRESNELSNPVTKQASRAFPLSHNQSTIEQGVQTKHKPNVSTTLEVKSDIVNEKEKNAKLQRSNSSSRFVNRLRSTIDVARQVPTSPIEVSNTKPKGHENNGTRSTRRNSSSNVHTQPVQEHSSKKSSVRAMQPIHGFNQHGMPANKSKATHADDLTAMSAIAKARKRSSKRSSSADSTKTKKSESRLSQSRPESRETKTSQSRGGISKKLGGDTNIDMRAAREAYFERMMANSGNH